MNNHELLIKLEEIHRLTAQAILELRELCNNAENLTETAKSNIQDKINQLIGTEQVKTDGLPDLRQYAIDEQ